MVIHLVCELWSGLDVEHYGGERTNGNHSGISGEGVLITPIWPPCRGINCGPKSRQKSVEEELGSREPENERLGLGSAAPVLSSKPQ